METLNKVKHINLKEIKNPLFLRKLSYADLDVLTDDIRKEIIDHVSKTGGHLSSNLGVVELTIGLHRVFDLSKDKLIFDVGHQCYAHKILTGRDLSLVRKEGGLSGFQKRKESVYDVYEAGHSSTALSAANGFAIARDLHNENYDVIAFVGDGSIVNGLSFEGLNSIGRSNHKVIVIFNDNGMSIAKPVGSIAKALENKEQFARENLFKDLGFDYLGPIDGNNLVEVEKVLRLAKENKNSIVIHATTLKGKGYKVAEEDEDGTWHGVSPFDVNNASFKAKPEGMIYWHEAYANFVRDKMNSDKNVALVAAAMTTYSSLEGFKKEFPDRTFDVGIAEEHAITLSSALSLENVHPVISIYSTFMQRAYDELSHDLARMNCNSTILVDRAGFIGTPGETHQGIYDEAYLTSIPNTIISMASSLDEAKALFDESFANHGPFFIRVPNLLVKEQENINEVNVTLGKWKYVLKDSSDVALITLGPVVNELKEKIQSLGLKVTLINALFIKPIDKSMLDELQNYSKIVLFNPYSTREGLVNSVMAYLLEKNYKGSISGYFIPTEFVAQGTVDQQLKRYKLTVDDVIEELKK